MIWIMHLVVLKKNHHCLMTNLPITQLMDELQYPTRLDFLAKDDILVIEKNTGKLFKYLSLNIPIYHLYTKFKKLHESSKENSKDVADDFEEYCAIWFKDAIDEKNRIYNVEYLARAERF